MAFCRRLGGRRRADGRRARTMLARLGQAGLAPLWAVQLFSAAKSFERNPLLGSRRLNEWGLHTARVRLAYRLAMRRRRRLADLVSAEDRAAFLRDGFVVRQNFLPRPDFAALVAEVKAYRGLMRKIPLDRRALAALPTVRKVLRAPEWRGLIRYIGSRNSEPVVWVQSLWRQACDGPADPQTFLHADTFHPTVKAWLFLTDVAADAGPFTYVPARIC